MTVAVETVVVQALNIATGVEVPVAIPIFTKEDVEVTYGIDGLPTVQNVDYTVEQLDEQNFDTFIITPMAALLTKINNLIAADPTHEINAIFIRRKLDYKTSATADAVKNTPYTAKEFDRTAARFQQLQEALTRCIKFVKSVTSGDELSVRPLSPNHVPVISADGNYIEDGPTVTQVEDAEAFALAAQASAAAAASSETNAEADRVTVAADKAIVAADKATVAADKGIVAADKATVAADKGIVAADKATVNTDKGIVAADKATVAADKAAAAASAATATTQATNASNSASAAATSETNTAAIYDAFDDRYLGSKAAAPTLDNDGNALLTGASYWNSTSSTLNFWSGSAWNTFDVSGLAALAGALFTGRVTTVASASGGSGFRVPHGAAPSAPVNGDEWSTTGGWFGRVNGTTLQFAMAADVTTLTSLAGIAYVAGDLPYFSGTKAAARLAKGTAGQVLHMNAAATAPEWVDGVEGGTTVATTSGTSIDVTGIPSYAKEITINFSSVSTNGTSLLIVQLGDSGGVETSSYIGTTSGITNAAISNSHSTGFIVHTAGDAASIIHGSVRLTREDVASNTWVASVTTALSNGAYSSVGAGSKALSAALDRIRLTTVGGTNTFDGGSINVTYK